MKAARLCVCATGWLLAAGAVFADDPAFRVQPSEVLVVFDDTYRDDDRNGRSDSRDVAEYYAKRRGIPGENLLPLDLKGPDGKQVGGDYPDFYDRILTPVARKLESRSADGSPFKERIVYIVVCYGLPTALEVHLDGKKGEHPFREGVEVQWGAGRRSLDQWLIDVEANFAGGYDKATGKPTRAVARPPMPTLAVHPPSGVIDAPPGAGAPHRAGAAVPQLPLGARNADVRHPELLGLYADPRRAQHFKALKRKAPRQFPYYLVARLGTSPAVAAAQVDGALYAERYLRLGTDDPPVGLARAGPRDRQWQPRIVLDHQPGFAADHVAALARLAALLLGTGPNPLFAASKEGLLRPWPVTVDNERPEIGEPDKEGTPHRPTLTATIERDGVDTAAGRVVLGRQRQGPLNLPAAPYWRPGLTVSAASGGTAQVLGVDLDRNALRLSTVDGFSPGDAVTWQWAGEFPIADCFFYYGFYGLGKRWDCYQFLPGAIGIHVDSSCMTWARHQLTRGLSVAFGVVTEPFSSGIPYMDRAWAGIATGHDVCESLYAGLYANTRWAGVLFADPLYAPFRSLGLRDDVRPVLREVKAEPGRPGELVVTAELDDRTPDQHAELALFSIDCTVAASGSPASSSSGQTVPYIEWPDPQNAGQVAGRRYAYARRFRHTIAGLRPDTPYRVRVRARDPYGNESAPAEVTVRTTRRPGQ